MVSPAGPIAIDTPVLVRASTRRLLCAIQEVQGSNVIREIENRVRHVRDAACGEDRSRIRAGKLPRNMACLSRPPGRSRAGADGSTASRRSEAGKERLTNFAMTLQHRGMSTKNVSLPQALRSFVDEQAASRGYGATIANFVDFRRLMRAARLRLGALVNQTELGRDIRIPRVTAPRYLEP